MESQPVQQPVQAREKSQDQAVPRQPSPTTEQNDWRDDRMTVNMRVVRDKPAGAASSRSNTSTPPHLGNSTISFPTLQQNEHAAVRIQEPSRKRPFSIEVSDHSRPAERNVSPRVTGGGNSPLTLNNPTLKSVMPSPTVAALIKAPSPRNSPLPSSRRDRNEITPNALKGSTAPSVKRNTDAGDRPRFNIPSSTPRNSRDVETQIDDILTKTSKRLRDIKQDSGDGAGAFSEIADNLSERIVNNTSTRNRDTALKVRDHNVPSLVAALERDSYLLASALCRYLTINTAKFLFFHTLGRYCK